MNSELLKYLKQDGIGKVIAQGLADVYTSKPETPVKYLAAWLKKYSANQCEIAKLQQAQKVKGGKAKQYQDKCKQEEKKVVEKKAVEGRCAGELEAFKNKVGCDEYQKELLARQLPQFLQKKVGLTGAYIGYVNHPPREITDQDESQNSHLDTSQPKMINYIGSSASHCQLMKGKTLLLDKGVTGGAFSLSLDDPQPNEDGTVQVKDKYVYIPNVVKNQSMHYFKWPKLGAYIAIPLVYKCYLRQNIFDVALEAKEKYLEELADFTKQQNQDVTAINAEIEAATQKLEDAQDKNDEAAIEAAKAEIEEANKKKNDRLTEKCDQEQVDLPTSKKQFVFCADTMGQDCQISCQHRKFLVEMVKYFRDCWEKKQKQLLYKDVNYQVQIKKDQKTPEEMIQHLEKCCQIPAEELTSFGQIQDEQLREYKKSTWQLDALKKELKQGERYLADFFKIKNFRVVKFRTLIQTLLYFLGYQKSKINQQGRAILDWKKVSANYLFAQTFNAFLDYNTQGPKTGTYPFYCKLQHIKQNLQKHTQADVFNYNVGLGGILTLVKKMIAHRISNIELRKSMKEKERERIAAIKEKNAKIQQEKQAALDKHKLSLSVEQNAEFKEQDWLAEYEKQNPTEQQPPAVVDDIDNDF